MAIAQNGQVYFTFEELTAEVEKRNNYYNVKFEQNTMQKNLYKAIRRSDRLATYYLLLMRLKIRVLEV